MDENLLSLLEELSIRASCSEDEIYVNNGLNSNYCTSSSNVSSPANDQLANSLPEDLELKNAVNSLIQDLKPSINNYNPNNGTVGQNPAGYDKSKLLVALLGNIDLVTCAVKKINQLVSLGKRMEQIYRGYYVNPNIELDLEEISQLIIAFSNIYNSENYVREVNVSRVYQAYCRKLMDIYNARTSLQEETKTEYDDQMIS